MFVKLFSEKNQKYFDLLAHVRVSLIDKEGKSIFHRIQRTQ